MPKDEAEWKQVLTIFGTFGAKSASEGAEAAWQKLNATQMQWQKHSSWKFLNFNKKHVSVSRELSLQVLDSFDQNSPGSGRQSRG